MMIQLSRKKIASIIGILLVLILSSCSQPTLHIENGKKSNDGDSKEMIISGHILNAESQLISNAYGGFAEYVYKYTVDENIRDKVFYLKVRGNEGEFYKKTLLEDENITKKCSFVLGTDINNKTIYIGLEDEETHGFSGPQGLDIPDYSKEELEKEVLEESVSIEKGKMIPLETYYAIDEDGNKKEVFSICVEFK